MSAQNVQISDMVANALVLVYKMSLVTRPSKTKNFSKKSMLKNRPELGKPKTDLLKTDCRSVFG
jgi:hypothetical protein